MSEGVLTPSTEVLANIDDSDEEECISVRATLSRQLPVAEVVIEGKAGWVTILLSF